MRIIISGGGTGGHVYPAIAIGNALKERGVENILFVGAEGKLEMEKVPKAGFEIKGLNIRGLYRTRKWRNVTFPFLLVDSLMKSKKIIDKFGPDVVVGVGGYASGPILKIAQDRGIPTVIQEQNSYPGITNRLLAKKANKICVAYEEVKRYFTSNKVVLTGNPVRKDLSNLQDLKSQAYQHFELDASKKTILIFGGSLGAKSINKAVEANGEILGNITDTQIIWQVGKLYYDEYKACGMSTCRNVKILPFIDRMDYAYAIANIILCRAGALTISELALVGKPAILVPSPNVAEDHQTKNALALVNAGAAELLNDKELESNISNALQKLLNDVDRQSQLSQKILSFGRPDAREDIADLIISIAKS